MHSVGVCSERQGSKPVAWVTLVLGLDLSYVAAATVMASALKRLKTKGECVCMVTPDVPETARQLLSRVFDLVVEVPYLQTLALQKYSERFDAMYNYWLDKCFTKCGMFALVEYEKVIFLDADMLPLENPDVLFDCPAPAGICSSVKDAGENTRLHGMPLPRLLIDESLKNGQGRYGVRGCLLIMKPDLTVYHQIRNKVETIASYGSLDSMVGPDEHLITKHFSDQWHHVHAKYGWVSWADRQDLDSDPCFLHFVSQKPWDEGEAWEDFEYWKNEAKELLKHCPDAIVYFSHITEEMAESAGVALTDEMRSISKKLIQEAREKKLVEKTRREERARELGIDLTLGAGSRGGSWLKGRQDGIPPSPMSARAAPLVGTTPRSVVPPPNSARGPSDKQEDAVVVKVSTNVLMVSGFKRPNGTVKQKETRPKNINKNKAPSPNDGSNKEPVAVKPMVPKLNLEGVHGSAGAGGGGGQKPGWNVGHWKKKTGDSKADIEDWRTPSARLATPERVTEELRPGSARNWPGTPTSGTMSARRSTPYTAHPPKHAQTPKSSRADMASSWRSTPRTESSERANNKLSPYGEAINNQRGPPLCNNFQDRAVDRGFCGGRGMVDASGPNQTVFRAAANQDPSHPRNITHF